MSEFANWEITTQIDHPLAQEVITAIEEIVGEIKARVPLELNPFNSALTHHFKDIRENGLDVQCFISTEWAIESGLWEKRAGLPLAFLAHNKLKRPALFFTDQCKKNPTCLKAAHEYSFAKMIQYLFLHEIFELLLLEKDMHREEFESTRVHTDQVDGYWLKYFPEHAELSELLV